MPAPVNLNDPDRELKAEVLANARLAIVEFQRMAEREETLGRSPSGWLAASGYVKVLMGEIDRLRSTREIDRRTVEGLRELVRDAVEHAGESGTLGYAWCDKARALLGAERDE